MIGPPKPKKNRGPVRTNPGRTNGRPTKPGWMNGRPTKPGWMKPLRNATPPWAITAKAAAICNYFDSDIWRCKLVLVTASAVPPSVPVAKCGGLLAWL